jgi:hypothetical protein
MHRSSETIASLAAALAKAQMALTNPEKSLTGTCPATGLRSPAARSGYAPLSSGLDIVRNVLATAQINRSSADGTPPASRSTMWAAP